MKTLNTKIQGMDMSVTIGDTYSGCTVSLEGENGVTLSVTATSPTAQLRAIVKDDDAELCAGLVSVATAVLLGSEDAALNPINRVASLVIGAQFAAEVKQRGFQPVN